MEGIYPKDCSNASMQNQTNSSTTAAKSRFEQETPSWYGPLSFIAAYGMRYPGVVFYIYVISVIIIKFKKLDNQPYYICIIYIGILDLMMATRDLFWRFPPQFGIIGQF